VVRHIITTEEFWWHGGICGLPFEQWRPADWDRRTDEEKAAHRAKRFPTVASLLEGLRDAHAPVAQFLEELDAWALCERRRSAWGEENVLRWMLWHLVEHDQHHRGQVCARLRMLGRQPPAMFPRVGVMGWTPAAHWRPGEVEIRDVVPFWKAIRSTLHAAVASLNDADLSFRPAEGFPCIHDLILHLLIWEDYLIRQMLKGEAGETPRGLQTLHHTLWYAREHAVHHRAQLFLAMRMSGRTPPELWVGNHTSQRGA
jgi:uncharacterized damage-inducible protein DinB